MMLAFNSGRQGMSLLQKIWQINWSLVVLLLALAGTPSDGKDGRLMSSGGLPPTARVRCGTTA